VKVGVDVQRSHTGVFLFNAGLLCPCEPVSAGVLHIVGVKQTRDLRLTFDELESQALGRVPTNVAMHLKIRVNNSLKRVTWLIKKERLTSQAPGLSVRKAITRYPAAGRLAVSRLGGLSRLSWTELSYSAASC
jgi:hypothetical protein